MKILAVAALASSALAMGELGFNIGGKRNSDGACKEATDYEADFKVLKGTSNIVRTYAASDCNTLAHIGPALEASGFSAFLGVWPNDDAHFQAEKEALKTYLPKISRSHVKAFIVGSEALYRKDMTADQLASKISEIKKFVADLKDKNGEAWSSVPVGTADSWNIWVAGYNEAAIKASDIILSNGFSYWQGQTMDNASFSFFDDMMQSLQTVQSAKGSTDIQFWVGETGWATEGGNFQASQPSVQNAQKFWKEAICAIRGWGLNVLAFEAFDESWKPPTSGIESVENHWGVWDSNNKLKYDISC